MIVGPLVPLRARVRQLRLEALKGAEKVGGKFATDLDTDGLNIEGAALLGDAVRLFQRGNGAATNATYDISREGLLGLLLHRTLASPMIARVVPWDLGDIDGVPLGFTDAVATEREIWFLGAAESSPSTIVGT